MFFRKKVKKVYCSNCIHFSGSGLFTNSNCTHPSNVIEADNWHSTKISYVEKPESINELNNCPNYKCRDCWREW